MVVQSIQCLVGIWRWQRNEKMNATIVKVPAIFLAYNLFMNGVDRYDQLQAGNSTAQK